MDNKRSHIFILDQEYKECCVCRYYKKLKYFGYSKVASDKLNSKCKNCGALIYQEKMNKKNPKYKYRGRYQHFIPGVTIIRKENKVIKEIPRIYVLGIPYKQCSKCKYWKILVNFHNNRSTIDKLNYACKECISIRPSRPRGGPVGRPKGYKVSEKTKDKIRQKAIGKTLSFEHKNKIRKKLMGNTNRRENYSTITDNLMTDYVKDYSDENIGSWINDNKKALEEVGIKSEHELGSMSIRDVKLFDMPCSDIPGIDPLNLLILKEELEEMQWEET